LSWAAPELSPASGEPSAGFQQTRPNRQQGPLPGYATENLFWFGRYQERLACQARAWRVLLSLAGEWHRILPDGSGRWLRMVRAWQPDFPDVVRDARALEALLEHSLDDEPALGSPAFNRAALRRTARAVRDLLPDDCWLAVNTILDPVEQTPPLRRLDRGILLMAGLAGLETESIAQGPVRRFLSMGRSVERALCTVRALSAGLGGNLKPSDTLLESLLAFHDSDLMYRQRYQREIQAGAAADLLIVDESNPRSIACQLTRFAEELAGLPQAQSALLTACQKTALKALTSVRVFEPGENGILGPGGNEAFEHLLSSLESWLGRISEFLSREFFQPVPLPQSLREWT
jgi:uncharacterized alpha-E superfamily protein